MKTWIESIANILLSLATLGVTIFIAWQQSRLKKREVELDERRYRREQYEKRLAIYQTVTTFLTRTSHAFATERNFEGIDYDRFLQNTTESQFLFEDPEISEFINEIYQKARKLHEEIQDYEYGREPHFTYGGEEVDRPLSEEALSEIKKRIGDLKGWFRDEGSTVALNKFKRYLQV